MKYGYDFDSGHAFCFKDNKFDTLGIIDPKTIGINDINEGCVYFDSESKELYTLNKNYAYMIGAYHLSGIKDKKAIVIFSDGVMTVSFFIYNDIDGFNFIPFNLSKYKNDDLHMNIIVCGNVCKMPQYVAEIGNMFKCNPMYFCPLVDELTAFGALITGMRKSFRMPPLKTRFWKENKEEIKDVEYNEFDENLEEYNDAYGRMAYAVSLCNKPVTNQIKTNIGISPFYGKLLSTKILNDSTVFLLSYEWMESYFPTECISTRAFASTCVPVTLKNTENFKKDSGYDNEHVTVFSFLTGYSNALVFSNFCHIMGGKKIICSYEPKSLQSNKINLVYRYNKAYRVPKEIYENGII